MSFKFKFFCNYKYTNNTNILFFLLFSGFLYAQDYYVSAGGGSDSNEGSETAPFKTINKAISQVSPGGTVYVMEGTYRNNGYGTVNVSNYTNMNLNHVVTINKSGTEGNYITLRNYPGDLPLIEFDGRGGIVISNNMNLLFINKVIILKKIIKIDYVI